MVTGRLRPLTVNAALLELTALTMTLEPLAVRLPVPVPLVPTTTLPIAIVAGLAARTPAVAAVPVPDSGTVSVGFDPFDVTVRFPLALAADAGVNFTLKVAPCPAVSVTGGVIPLTLNPVPLAETAEIVTVVPPVFVTVSDSESLLPTCTLPKLRVVGFDPSVPSVTPVPLTGIVSVGFVAVDVTVT